MPISRDRQSALLSSEGFLVGLVAAIIATDGLLLVVAPSDGMAELLRVACAMGAFGAVALGLVIGLGRTPLYGLTTPLVVPVVVVYAYTGLLLPWTQLSFHVGQVVVAALLSVPIVGKSLTITLVGGFTPSAETHQIAFQHHYAIVTLALLGLLVPVGRAVRHRHHSSSTDSLE